MNFPIYHASFSPDFLWGAATAGHQVEGNNTNSDWWVKENDVRTLLSEASGDAVDSYHRYEEDIALLAASGLNSYRFSIEWSRIEPVRGKYSRAEIAHYRRMVETCLEYGVEPVVTLSHFTTPQWFAELGGWASPLAPEFFRNYVRCVLPVLENAVRYVVTINEPNITAMLAGGEKAGEQLIAGQLPYPDQDVTNGLIAAHHGVRDLLRAAGHLVGWSVAPQQFFADPGAEKVLEEYAYPRETVFLEASRGDDYVGVQAYTRTRITLDGPVPASEEVERTITGWEYYPQAIAEAALKAASITNLPVFVTENGIATADDVRRIEYTAEALSALSAEVGDGLNLVGYLHWSLLDNYEWGSYAPTFGLIAVDRETFERHPKPSLAWLGRVAKNGGF